MHHHVPHTNPMRRQWLLQPPPAGLVARLSAAVGHVDSANTLGLGPHAVLAAADLRRQHRGYVLLRLSFLEAPDRPAQDMSDLLGPLQALAEYPRRPSPPPSEKRFYADVLDRLRNSPDRATGTRIVAPGLQEPSP
jgi:hypothetical protein